MARKKGQEMKSLTCFRKTAWITAIKAIAIAIITFIFVAYAAADSYAAEETTFGLVLNETMISQDQSVSGAVRTESDHVTNGIFTVTYDANVLTLLEAKKSDIQTDVFVSINTKEEGKITVAFASEDPILKGDFIDLKFHAKSRHSSIATQIVTSLDRIYDENDKKIGDKKEEKTNLSITGKGGASTIIPGTSDKPGNSDNSDKNQAGTDGKKPDGSKDNPDAQDSSGNTSNNGNGQNTGSGKDYTGDQNPGNDKDHQSDQSGDADQTHDVKNPKTGDDMKLTVYFVLVLLSGTAAAVVIRRKAGAKREESR